MGFIESSGGPSGPPFFVVEYMLFVVKIRQFGETCFARTRKLYILA